MSDLTCPRCNSPLPMSGNTWYWKNTTWHCMACARSGAVVDGVAMLSRPESRPESRKRKVWGEW